jgi:hypothetical protein
VVSALDVLGLFSTVDRSQLSSESELKIEPLINSLEPGLTVDNSMMVRLVGMQR